MHNQSLSVKVFLGGNRAAAPLKCDCRVKAQRGAVCVQRAENKLVQVCLLLFGSISQRERNRARCTAPKIENQFLLGQAATNTKQTLREHIFGSYF